MEENPSKQIKIYCPTHQSVFEVVQKPQIICEIREHALSSDFPHAEVWEYCCDCLTFSPSNLGTGAKVRDACPHCERATVDRFFCDECEILSFDSGEETKGKQFNINSETGIEPNCPGCQKSFGAAKPQLHNCTDVEGAFLTHRKECSFCQKPVVAKPSYAPQNEPVPNVAATAPPAGQTGLTQCPGCGHWDIAHRNHCGKCGMQINAPGAEVIAGSTVPRTQLLGSICPNCGAGNPSGSSFCPNCGQALKTSPQAGIGYASQPNFKTQTLPPQVTPNQPQVTPNQPTGSFPAGQTAAFNVPPPSQPPKSKMPLFLIAGAIACFIVILIAISASKPDYAVNNANYTNNTVATGNTKPSTPSKVNNGNRPTPANTMNSNSSSSDIGKKGRLITNLRIRSAPNKTAEILGTHYQNARIEVLDSTSFTADDGEYVTWYKVRVLENGCDTEGKNGCGNDIERDGYKYYGEAEMEGWMNSKYIRLD
jgi:hypothetical protein